ncbi:MAG: hypothetical protein HY954_05460 [Deltaproteobacteria bacterium]|nr:hypothetical protein [Deltaproteobacteria bacterium]
MRSNKALILFVILLLPGLASCRDNVQKKEQAPSTGEVIKKYTDTLTAAPVQAKDAANAAGDRAAQEEKAIKELEN